MMNFNKIYEVKIPKVLLFLFLASLFSFSAALTSFAATLSLSPSTGVYSSNSTFTVRVLVNTAGKPVNAAEGTLSFNPNELSVVSANRAGSIFNLWVTEPTFSNAAGTINFSGGLPSGYTGRSGNIMNVTFRAKGAGATKVNFTNGSVLANDGKGTNILTSMNGGNYTIQANVAAPEPEVIEYIAPANTPSAPKVSSGTHTDPPKWYAENRAVLNWTLPADVIAVRTSLNDNPTSVPTKVYDSPIKSITLDDLEDGVTYFHLQFKNDEGWGRVTHFRLGVDTQNPTDITIENAEGVDPSNPVQTLKLQVEDETTEVYRYFVKIDSQEGFEYIDDTGSSTIVLPSLEPGYHTVIIEAFDEAGNSIVGTHSFTINSFDKPVFTEYPSEINQEVIPVIKGQTRPSSSVTVKITRLGSESNTYELSSDSEGEFVFIPEGTFTNGVYELTAQAVDEFGAQSDLSETVRIAVQEPGYLRVGSFIVSILSVFVPLLVLLFLLALAIWYMFIYARRFRRKVRVESVEALDILHKEFSSLHQILVTQESNLKQSRKTKKLTKAEDEMITVFGKALMQSQAKVEKEIEDVTDLTDKQK